MAQSGVTKEEEAQFSRLYSRIRGNKQARIERAVNGFTVTVAGGETLIFQDNKELAPGADWEYAFEGVVELLREHFEGIINTTEG